MQKFNSKHVIISSRHYPPGRGGTSVIMENLLNGIESSNYSIITQNETNKIVHSRKNIYNFIGFISIHKYIDILVFPIMLVKLFFFIKKIAKSNKSEIIVAVYPDLLFIAASYFVSMNLKIKFVPYLHDTISESLADRPESFIAKKIQKKIFKNADKILVISDGVKKLLDEKYSIASTTIKHTYPEKINSIIGANKNNSVFWGGEIYRINKNSLKRIISPFIKSNYKITMASVINDKMKTFLDLNNKNVLIKSFGRNEYLQILNEQDILILALDWPNESQVHNDELATIFPTKTIEYLAAGKIIIVHCPESYFLSSFFKENNCGIVLNDNNEEVISQIVENVIDKIEDYEYLRKNAQKVALQYSHSEICELFVKCINDVQTK